MFFKTKVVNISALVHAIGITFVVTIFLSVGFTLLLVYIVCKAWTKKQKTATDLEEDVPSDLQCWHCKALIEWNRIE